MQLHQLQISHKRKKAKRIGRGGKRGTYSGRGMKGQKARAGHRIRPAERDLILKLPKLRGHKNRPLRPKPAIIKLSDLERKISGGVVDRQVLINSGLIKKRDRPVKIVGDGRVSKVFEIKGIALSKSARQKIEAAGGSVEAAAENSLRVGRQAEGRRKPRVSETGGRGEFEAAGGHGE